MGFVGIWIEKENAVNKIDIKLEKKKAEKRATEGERELAEEEGSTLRGEGEDPNWRRRRRRRGRGRKRR